MRVRSLDRCSPGWRNWQTQGTQNPPIFGSCGFKSHPGHSVALGRSEVVVDELFERLDVDG